MLLLLLPLLAGAEEPRQPRTLSESIVEFPLDEIFRAREEARKGEAEALDKLRERYSVEIKHKPLTETLQQFAEMTKLSFRLESAALEEEGISTDTSVTLETIRPQRMIDLLPRVLQPLQLTWRLEGRDVVVTTGAKAKLHLELRSYPIGRLLRLAAQRENRFPVFPVVPIVGIPSFRDRTAAELAEFLVDFSLLSVIDGPWNTHNGEGGNAKAVQETLLVHQNFHSHREIASLLHAIEMALARPPGSPPLKAFESDDDTATMVRLQRMLGKEVEVAFTETPLFDVATYLSDFFEEGIVVDVQALTEEGIAPDSAVTFTGHLPFRAAMHCMLRPLGLAVDLRNGAAFITTHAKFKEHHQIVVYDVADFLKAGFAPSELIRLVEETNSGRWTNSDGGKTTQTPGGLLLIRQNAEVQTEIALLLHDLRQSMREDARQPIPARIADLETRFHRAKSKREAEALDQLIQTFVAPKSWDVSGGRGQLRTAEDRLIIRQTKAIHEQIERFLREYQQANPIGTRSHAPRGNESSDALRPVCAHDAERQCVRSHAERGNESGRERWSGRSPNLRQL